MPPEIANASSSKMPLNLSASATTSSNPLQDYFDHVQEGPGVWKWCHYFEIYHRHFQQFVGREAVIVEVGVYSGGSLLMWKNYFGPSCRVHGIDIREECRVYEDVQTTIHIGDQSDRLFWKHFRESVPAVDVLIDDGGHLYEQQRTTLEEMLPHLKPGGVYLCEDVHGTDNRFSAFIDSLSADLNALSPIAMEGGSASQLTSFQAAVHSIHRYPFVVLIEKRDIPVQNFVAPKRGTQWQPFF